jgi:hypothetical protein
MAPLFQPRRQRWERHFRWHGPLGAGNILDAMDGGHPLSMEEAFFKVVWDALTANELVIMDDLHLLADVVAGGCHHYPRNGLLKIPLTVLTRYAHEQKRKLVFSADGPGLPSSANKKQTTSPSRHIPTVTSLRHNEVAPLRIGWQPDRGTYIVPPSWLIMSASDFFSSSWPHYGFRRHVHVPMTMTTAR